MTSHAENRSKVNEPRTIVFSRNELQSFNRFGIATFANQEFGRFTELDDRDSQDRHHKTKPAGGISHISPCFVVSIHARSRIRAAIIRQNCPREKDPLLTALSPSTRQEESGAIDPLTGGTPKR